MASRELKEYWIKIRMKIIVKNDGTLKIGMPAEVNFKSKINQLWKSY